tara:strand:- start:491 stop:649 length:159 start_codon:yes stop_codon:yes gene_type:complete
MYFSTGLDFIIKDFLEREEKRNGSGKTEYNIKLEEEKEKRETPSGYIMHVHV